MRRICYLYFLSLSFLLPCNLNAQRVDSLSNYVLDSVSVVSFYRNNVDNTLSRAYISSVNKGQDPSFILNSRPSIFAYSDTGNEYGYSYFRLRGMDQTRVNMTLDGMPLNEGEDMGVYFSNYPDFISSMHSVQVNPGAGVSSNGVASYAGNIDFESVNLLQDTLSSVYAGYGSFNTYRICGEYNSGRLGKYSLHLRATHQYSDGYREHSYNNSQSIFLKAGYFINSYHTVDFLSFVGQQRNSQGWIGSSLEELEINPRTNGCADSETDLFIQSINKVQYKARFSDRIHFTSSLYYNQLWGHYFFDLDNYMKRVWDPTWDNTGEIDKYGLRHHMYGGNAALKFFSGPFSARVGLNYSMFLRNHKGTNNLGDDVLWDNRGYKNDLNAFINTGYVIHGLTASATIQFRHADFDYVGDTPFNKLNWDFFNYSLAAEYALNPIHSIKISFTQVGREPTRTDMFGGEENLTVLGSTVPEKVYDTELSYRIHSDNLELLMNGFYMSFKDELILNGEMGKNGLPLRETVTQSYRRGVELSLAWKPVSFLRLSNASSFSQNEIESDGIKSNHVMSPSVTISQDIDFNVSRFVFGLNLKYRSSMFIDLQNDFTIPGSFKANAYVRHSINGFEIGARVNNILNSTSYSNGMIGANGPLFFIDPPVNYMFDLRYFF